MFDQYRIRELRALVRSARKMSRVRTEFKRRSVSALANPTQRNREMTRQHETERRCARLMMHLRIVNVCQRLNVLGPSHLMFYPFMAVPEHTRVVKQFQLTFGLQMVGICRELLDRELFKDGYEELRHYIRLNIGQ